MNNVWFTHLRPSIFVVVIFLTTVPIELSSNPLDDKADDAEAHLSVEFERILSEVQDQDPLSKYKVFLFVFENRSSLVDDREQALAFLAEAADAGLEEAQFSLATLYRYGKWVEQDTELALRWMLMAASEGFLEARIESAGLLYRYAISREDESETQKYLAESVSRLRTDLVREDLHGEQELHLKMYLGRSLIQVDPSSKEGWQFLAQASCQGYDDAETLLSDYLAFINKSAGDGDSTAGEILKVASSEILARCSEAQVEKLQLAP